MCAQTHTPDITELLRGLELQLSMVERALSLWLELLGDVHLEVEGLRWVVGGR